MTYVLDPDQPQAEPATDAHTLDLAIDNDDWWLQAAAFGCAEAGKGHESSCTYLDAIRHLAGKAPKKDGRRGNRGHKTQATVGETMRRRIGGERYASA